MSPDGDGPDASRLAALVGEGALDAELAALLWLLVEDRIPTLVAGGTPADRSTVRAALLDLLPVGTRTILLHGARETFAWLPEAAELGWHQEGRQRGTGSDEPAVPGSAVLVADLVDRPPDGTWGGRARLAIRAVAIGYGMAATAAGDRLEDVLAGLAAPPVSATDDELTRLGVVLVMAPESGPPGTRRVAAAHYLRPVQRDAHGHVQRMPPAVIATWDPRSGRFEHFAWGIADELAGRTGRRVLDMEQEQARRMASLARRVAGDEDS